MSRQDSLARDYVAQEQQLPKEDRHSQNHPLPDVEPKQSRVTERAFIILFSVAAFIIMIFNIGSSVQLASASRNLQNINNEIEQTVTVNENLEQNVQELSRYDRVYDIAEENGLEFAEENIRNVE